MKFILTFLATSFLLLFWAGIYFVAKEPIVLDPSFAQALEAEAGIPSARFEPQSVREIIELNLSGYDLTTVDGLEYFTSLETLNLSGNRLSSIEGIEKLTNLIKLDVSSNALTDLNLASPMLQHINAENNLLTDIAFVEGLSQLHTLNIRDNNISELTALQDSKSLGNLNARGNRIADIEVLALIETLQDINLRNNRITDVSPLKGLEGLTERLYLSGNGITDYTPLAEIAPALLEKDFEVVSAPPQFSMDSGRVTAGSALTLQAASAGADIYYTVDGSLPTVQSPRYSGPILLDEELKNQGPILANIQTSMQEPFNFEASQVKQAIVVRAAVYEDGKMGETASKTFLLDEVTDSLPIISISTDAQSLFSDEEGIYVPGIHYNRMQMEPESNYHKRGRDWERAAHLEYFEPDTGYVFSQNIGVRIHGGKTRGFQQKSLRLYARSEYGQSRFYYPFFEKNPIEEFNQLLLRNSGNDWNSTMFRDALIQKLAADLPIDTQDYSPVVLLINGEYWGIHNLREYYSAEYIELKYHVDAANIVILKSDYASDTGFSIDEGSPGTDAHYKDMLAYAVNNDLKQTQHLEHLKEQLDLENYLTYMAVQIFIGNTDSVHNNTALWRKTVDFSEDAPLGHDGRWRWMLYDTDFGFARFQTMQDAINHNTMQWALREDDSTLLFRSLMQNETVQKRFQAIMDELIEGPFSTLNTLNTIDELQAQIAPEMPDHIERWKALPSIEAWEEQIARMKAFAEQRPAVVRQHVEESYTTLP